MEVSQEERTPEDLLQLDDLISYDVLDCELALLEHEIIRLEAEDHAENTRPNIEYLSRLKQEIKHRMNSLESQVNSLLLTEASYSNALLTKIKENSDRIDRNFEVSQDPIWIGKDCVSFDLPIYRYNSQTLKEQLLKHNEIMQTEITQLESTVEHQLRVNKQHEDERGDEITKVIQEVDDTLKALHDNPLSFGSHKYWQDFYQNEASPFEWYIGYKGLANVFHKVIPKESSVLVVGCGNSTLSEEMFIDGYKNITSIDFSAVVIEKMKKRMEKKGLIGDNFKWECMDACCMSFPSNHFDRVVDKGVLDAIICGETGFDTAELMLMEISRVLKPGGIFMLISCNVVFVNLQDSKYQWSLKHRPFRTKLNSICHLYIMKKHQ